jgi:PAS domain-containing protein
MPKDFTLALLVPPGDYEWSRVLLARASYDGTLELLTAAWARFLGYGPRELHGKCFGQVLGGQERPDAAVAAILDPRRMEPLDLLLRCRDGQEKTLRLHRRYDAYDSAMFIVAEYPPPN